jgi:soluble lytic murein transglycosylase-like protein
MRTRVSISLAILLTMLVLSTKRANAQVTFYTDDAGRRVYINAEPPAQLKVPHATASGSSHTTSGTPAASPNRAAVPPMDRDQLDKIVKEVSERHNVDPDLVRAVIEQESGWNPAAVSHAGAQGLMQLTPTTAQQLGVNNAFDPHQNIDAGVRYLQTLLVRYGGDLDKALAAYNAGPGAVDRAGGVPRIRETRDYVQRVTDRYYGPGSDRRQDAMGPPRSIYRSVDDQGRVVFTNE